MIENRFTPTAAQVSAVVQRTRESAQHWVSDGRPLDLVERGELHDELNANAVAVAEFLIHGGDLDGAARHALINYRACRIALDAGRSMYVGPTSTP